MTNDFGGDDVAFDLLDDDESSNDPKGFPRICGQGDENSRYGSKEGSNVGDEISYPCKES